VKHFLRLKADTVIATARTASKCKSTETDIQAALNYDGKLMMWELEYGSYASVLSFCSKVAKLDRVDNIMLNARLANTRYELFEGHESNVVVNVISTALLAVLLIPALQQSADRFKSKPMLTVTGSKIYTWAKFPERTASHMIEKLDASKDLSERYQVTKLLQLFAVLEIAKRSPARYPSVIVNIMSPGLVSTDLSRTAHGLERLQLEVLRLLFAWSPEQGGRTLVESATRGSDSHGIMLSEGRLRLPHVEPWIVADEGQKIQQRLWVELSEIIAGIQPEALVGFSEPRGN